MFRFSKRSLDTLATVDIDLQKVAMRAIQISTVDFAVVQGRRTLDEQMRLYGKGRTEAQCRSAGVPAAYARPGDAQVTWTVKGSNHLRDNAIDVAPFVNGKIEWDDNGRMNLWPKIATAFKQASVELGIPIRWGGDGLGSGSSKKIDRPHFELL